VAELPLIVSVDDHVVEPPTVWSDRLPAKYQEAGPRIVRAPMGEITFVGGKLTVKPGTEGAPTDWWHYEELRRPLLRLDSAAGVPRDEVTMKGITYEDMRPGSYQVKPRLEDMDVNHLEAALCFPTFPRFCGQTFLEAKDKELALLCVRAYNDWMVEEWCGESAGRLVPLCLIPLWDAQLAAEEIRRNAERGVRAVCFSEIPPFLGLPSVHDPENYWDPFFAACADTNTVVNMHIGSSSKMPSTSADAPPAVGSTLTHTNATFSVVDFLFSGVLVRFPTLQLAYSEGQIGWIPYILERADTVWLENRGWGGVADKVPEPPSTYFRRQVTGCFFDDAHGLRSVEEIGVDRITYESDYPHSDSTWPHTKEVAERQMAALDDEAKRKIVRGNAIALYGLDHLAP
jgi:predicted TIM-barrel fold metal-dependent hydrolase